MRDDEFNEKYAELVEKTKKLLISEADRLIVSVVFIGVSPNDPEVTGKVSVGRMKRIVENRFRDDEVILIIQAMEGRGHRLKEFEEENPRLFRLVFRRSPKLWAVIRLEFGIDE